jgi:hypothetical protein
VVITPSTRQTIYVDASAGNDGNNGLSSSSPVRSWQRANQLLADNTNVLFHRGQTFWFDNTFQLNNHNVTIGAYGSGANPNMVKINGAGLGIFYMTKADDQIVIENLTFDSVYTPVGNSAPEIIATGVYVAGRNITVRNNTFLNISTAVDAYQGPSGLLVQNNSAPNPQGLRDYFVWMNGNDQVILGNTVANSTRQHVVRSSFTTTNRVLIAGNDFANPSNVNGDSGDTQKTTVNIRAGSYVYVTNNTLRNATVAIGPDDALPENTVVPWFKFDGNTLLNSQLYVHSSTQHAMIDNNFSNLEYYQQFEIDTNDPSYPSRKMLDVTFTHNTGVQQGTIGSMLQIDGDATGGIITVTDNLFAAPNLQPGNQFATSIMVKANTDAAIAWSDGNVWAAPSPAFNYWYVPQGVIFIAAGLDPSRFLTASQWNGLSNVGTDTFRAVGVSLGGSLQVSNNGVMVGAVLPAKLF